MFRRAILREEAMNVAVSVRLYGIYNTKVLTQIETVIASQQNINLNTHFYLSGTEALFCRQLIKLIGQWLIRNMMATGSKKSIPIDNLRLVRRVKFSPSHITILINRLLYKPPVLTGLLAAWLNWTLTDTAFFMSLCGAWSLSNHNVKNVQVCLSVRVGGGMLDQQEKKMSYGFGSSKLASI